MSETSTQQLKPLRDYLHRVPGHRRGTRTNLSTGIRWATNGVKTATGEVVRLRAVRFGARWMTTDAWFDEFLGSFIPCAVGAGNTSPEPPTPAQRRRQQEVASARLDAALGTDD